MSESFITAARREILDLVETALPNVKVLNAQPETLYPPAAILAEDTPFITSDGTAGGYILHFELALYAEYSAENETMVKNVDAMVATILETMGTDFAISVDSYTVENSRDSQNYYGARLSLKSGGWGHTAQKG